MAHIGPVITAPAFHEPRVRLPDVQPGDRPPDQSPLDLGRAVRMRPMLTLLLPAPENSGLENCGEIQSFLAFRPYLVREVA
jgi:hypothetical protein